VQEEVKTVDYLCRNVKNLINFN